MVLIDRQTLTVSTATRARDQTANEEIANSLSHGIGFLLAVAALPVRVHAPNFPLKGALLLKI